MAFKEFFNRVIEKRKNERMIDMSLGIGVPDRYIYNWMGRTKYSKQTTMSGLDMSTLKRIRAYSGKSWSEVGKIIDEEF